MIHTATNNPYGERALPCYYVSYISGVPLPNPSGLVCLFSEFSSVTLYKMTHDTVVRNSGLEVCRILVPESLIISDGFNWLILPNEIDVSTDPALIRDWIVPKHKTPANTLPRRRVLRLRRSDAGGG